MIHIVIADNQPLTRYALEQLLQGMAAGATLIHASDRQSLSDILKAHRHATVILDYALFDFPDVLHLIALVQRHPDASWLLLSGDLAENFLRQVISQTRSVSVIFKDAALREVTEAMDRVIHGHRYICQRVTEMLLARQIHDQQHPMTLTPTEVEVIRCIAQGKTTKEIAAERLSSIHTINTHRKNIFRKFGVNTAHEAIKTAIRSGLIEESEYFI